MLAAFVDEFWNIPSEVKPSGGYGGGKSNWWIDFSCVINGFCGVVGTIVDEETTDDRELLAERSLRRNLARRFWNQTCTLDSVSPTFWANSSRTNASIENNEGQLGSFYSGRAKFTHQDNVFVRKFSPTQSTASTWKLYDFCAVSCKSRTSRNHSWDLAESWTASLLHQQLWM